jgi:hypothetical protein
MDEIIKDRKGLEQLFTEGSIPTQKDFKTLIDSVVVKRDDKFFGKWKSGVGYVEGDVVLYEDEVKKQVSIYVFVSKKTAQALNPDCDTDDDCGNKPPNACCRWQLIHLDFDDGDWFVDEESQTMYAKVFGKIGIGTKAPAAFLHINDTTEGAGSQFLFNPTGAGGAPRFQMVNAVQSQFAQEATQLEQLLNDDVAQWLTNTPLGFVFKKQATNPTVAQNARHTEGGVHEDTLLLLVSNEGNRPRIGIGTNAPNSALEVTNEVSGSAVQLDVDTDEKPQLILLKQTEGKLFDVAQSIDNQLAMWTTNAPHGYLFAHDSNETVVSINANGNVGIGTTEPKTKLEITDNAGQKGKFNFDVNQSIPIMEITNLLEGESEVTMSVAVHIDSTVFSTDAAQGYAFLHDNFEEPALSLIPEDTQFYLNLDGLSNSRGVYVRPLLNDNKNQPLTEGLKILKTLTPQIRKPDGDNHPQMGFVFKPKDAKTQLPSEIVRQFPGQTFGIAQHNLIATLVRAVQELEEKITKLEAKVNDLEKPKGK